MEIKDKYVVISFIILLLVAGFTIYNLNHNFKPNFDKCSSGLKIISICGCIPDQGFANLLKYDKITGFKINLSENEDGS